jgi:hypothetical protein
LQWEVFAPSISDHAKLEVANVDQSFMRRAHI